MIKVILKQDHLNKKAGDEMIIATRDWPLYERLGIAEKPKKVVKSKKQKDD